MITDQALRVSTAQAVTTTAVSVDSIDLQNARDLGEGKEFYMVFTVGAANFAGGTSIQFEAIVADNGALTTNPTVMSASAAIVTAQLVAGAQIVLRMNPLNPVTAVPTARRFLGARYTVVGTMNAGTITADVVLDYQGARRAYPSGFTVT